MTVTPHHDCHNPDLTRVQSSDRLHLGGRGTASRPQRISSRFSSFSYRLLLGASLSLTALCAAEVEIRHGHVGGYTSVEQKPADPSYNSGFSLYAAAWPLQREHPGPNFQSGLFGTWMFPKHDTPPPVKFYSDIEGGLGWWRGTSFATETPKFIMGGVQQNFAGWANGPGAGAGLDWDKPRGCYGVAQLSSRLVFPLAGLSLKEGTCGELFGYGYLPLPLADAKSTTAGKDIPTGNQCWTLFLNTANFKGPVAFFTPYFWSRASVDEPRLSGMFLDSRPSQANKPFSMETQHIACAQATDSKGETYARMAPTQYPMDPNGDSTVMHRLAVYNRKALWDGVKAWFDGGDPVRGTIAPEGTHVQEFVQRGKPGWKINTTGGPEEEHAGIDSDPFMNSVVSNPTTFGFRWNNKLVTRTQSENGSLVTLPEYYHLVKNKNGKGAKWVAVTPRDVPAETGLAKVSFKQPPQKPLPPLVTPEEPESCWKKPGPKAGPFTVDLGDGSTLTYHWYRFADQPALLNADLTDAEREAMQQRVEKLHRHWTMDRDYLAPPTVGKLANLDKAQIVTPPPGLEVGYVPIATRQKLTAK
jgi:hypothetical protein